MEISKKNASDGISYVSEASNPTQIPEYFLFDIIKLTEGILYFDK